MKPLSHRQTSPLCIHVLRLWLALFVLIVAACTDGTSRDPRANAQDCLSVEAAGLTSYCGPRTGSALRPL